jgi:hypothetical protein
MIMVTNMVMVISMIMTNMVAKITNMVINMIIIMDMVKHLRVKHLKHLRKEVVRVLSLPLLNHPAPVKQRDVLLDNIVMLINPELLNVHLHVITMVLPTRKEILLTVQMMIATLVLVPMVKPNVQQMNVILLLPVNMKVKNIKLMMNGQMNVVNVTVRILEIMLIMNVKIPVHLVFIRMVKLMNMVNLLMPRMVVMSVPVKMEKQSAQMTNVKNVLTPMVKHTTMKKHGLMVHV